MNKTCLALPLTYIVLALSAVQCGATERFSIVNEDFFGQGNSAVQPVLARHSPVSVLTANPAPQGLEAEMEAVQANLASLFADRRGTSLFRALPRGVAKGAVAKGAVAKLMQLIASAEAGGAQYDAVQHAAAVKPNKRPTAMTLGEIYDWIARTPGQQHAIGRYQFIPATLKRLADHVGAKRDDVFSPQLQDRLAHQLLEEAGLSAMMADDMSRKDFMHNLAKIWAGLPTPSGKSYYHGLAGNRAVLSWAKFDAEMARIFPG
ncbi:hypothetical protein ACFP4H_18460 [Pseudophaeobacter arcticus]|uniref:hypothetical protein n=1 Tax=Pseudophaeobacter arcticus TaxID=385492 RepID=UPI0004875D49|nr:hypothetical protein [Pseudophaeobacter arcticus]